MHDKFWNVISMKLSVIYKWMSAKVKDYLKIVCYEDGDMDEGITSKELPGIPDICILIHV